MQKRLFELVALGPELRDEAERQGKSVNESYLVVHRVLARAFKEDPCAIPSEGLRTYLKTQLREALQSRA